MAIRNISAGCTRFKMGIFFLILEIPKYIFLSPFSKFELFADSVCGQRVQFIFSTSNF